MEGEVVVVVIAFWLSFGFFLFLPHPFSFLVGLPSWWVGGFVFTERGGTGCAVEPTAADVITLVLPINPRRNQGRRISCNKSEFLSPMIELWEWRGAVGCFALCGGCYRKQPNCYGCFGDLPLNVPVQLRNMYEAYGQLNVRGSTRRDSVTVGF